MGRSRRAYRVYAEDDFLGIDDSAAETGTPGESSCDGAESSFDGAESYTAAPRGLSGPLGGRLGVALVALVAMAVSALVVHALRAGLSGGGEAARTSSAPPVAAARPPGARVPAARGSSPVAHASRRSSGFSFALTRAPRAARAGTSKRTSGGRPGVSDRLGLRIAATTPDEGGVGTPSESSAAAIPEFEFER
jgi:hypothetical protein